MMYCNECGTARGWPTETLLASIGPCEICHKQRRCNDVKSSELPKACCPYHYPKAYPGITEYNHPDQCPRVMAIKRKTEGHIEKPVTQLMTVCITVKVEDVYEAQLQQLEVCARGVFKVNEVRCGTYSKDEIYYPAKED